MNFMEEWIVVSFIFFFLIQMTLGNFYNFNKNKKP